eukprot:symbB.v1.2.029016.t1/scaffold3125.1/size63008/3
MTPVVSNEQEAWVSVIGVQACPCSTRSPSHLAGLVRLDLSEMASAMAEDGWDLRYISEVRQTASARQRHYEDSAVEEEPFPQDLPCAPRQQPPFAWKVASEFEREFEISGMEHDVATKIGDFQDPHWVVPVGGTLRLLKGGIYRWTLRLEHICAHRPQMQIGVHGANHRRPWRLMTTTRCSRAKDEDPWQERLGRFQFLFSFFLKRRLPLAAMDRPLDREDTVKHLENQAWIDCEKIDKLLQDHVKVIVSVDGSDQSSCAFEWSLHGFAQSDRETDLLIVHYYDNTKEYLPPKWRKNAIQSDVETKCTSYLVSKRYQISVKERTPGVKIGQLLCEDIKEQGAGFCVMGFAGRKGKDRHLIGSNVLEVMRSGRCSCIVFKESDPSKLPLSRPIQLNHFMRIAVFRTGDEIHVVYIRPYLEPHCKESKVTTAIRHKYDSIFEGMKDPAAWPSGKMVKFGDRKVKLVFAPQGINEGVAQALVRYANNFEADFVMVGTNVLRVDRGKPPVGSVSLQIVMEFPGNCVVSSFNPDLDR